VQHKFAGIPRSIWALTIFYNPNPQNEWEKLRGETAVLVREINEAAYLATVYDGNSEPKDLKKHKTVLISKIDGKLCVLSLGTWNIRKFGRSLPIQVCQQEEKSLDPVGY
jgi:hypothetical protein